ncbi:DUF1289 domain-containing protein [Methylobacterium aerolatum]|uniref:Fe-S protein YdhL (DUF1289 family) n=1 Tax=Methylobacterium aerolatum TaxID=418708 RepID=A0ABU0I0F5_9HYPH|nr:DUF1289 domain-containing protein [Methylobacterium aerolatum]MDQ0447523.1 putative Fe-S protein YdhL (DUF1289 family) [Methylobacterium aerolatum]GJD34624.1 hypothetical protein FMGBMHLM_1527 [Methylobacterium aerolatum]
MSLPPAKASSPCTKVCILDAETGLCRGCGRTRDEIGAWGSLREADRRAIMATLEARLRTAYPGQERPTA